MSLRGRVRGTTLVALVLALSSTASADQPNGDDVLAAYTITSWTGTNGFSFGNANAMAQDTTGYLWLGTSLGLVRFDGVQFVPLNMDGVPLNTIVSAVIAARDGSLWVGLTDGVVRIHNDHATMYTAREGFHGGLVRRFMDDGDGAIWTSGTGGIWRFRNDRWEGIGTDRGIRPRMSWTLFQDYERRIWAATAEGLFRQDSPTDTFQQVTNSSGFINDIESDATGLLWVTDPVRTLIPLPHEGTPRPWLKQRFGAASDLLRDRHGNLWAGTLGQGLLRVRPIDDENWDIAQVTQRDGLATNSIRALLEDREGNIWVGMAGGLARLSEKSVTSIAQGEAVSALATTRDGSVWIGTNSGLIRSIAGRSTRYSVNDGLPSATIRALHADNEDRLWVATNRGLARWMAGRFVTLKLPAGIPLQNVSALTTDRAGTLWMNDFDHGLFRLTRGIITAVNAPGLRPLMSAYADRAGRLWLGQLEGGLAAFKEGRFEFFATADGSRTGSVNTVYEDSLGTIWIGSTTGLSRLHDGRVVQIQNEHLAFGVVAIVEDNDNRLWLSTGAGILRVNLEELEKWPVNSTAWTDYRIYDAADGLPGVPTRALPAGVRSVDGSLWFATASGAARIDPQRLPEANLAPRIRIESVIADDRPLRPEPQTVLPPGTSRIEVQYALTTLNPPSASRFSYRLDGYDSDWVRAGTKREALYTNLPPRSYRFRVSTLGGGGSSREAVWDFSIAPRFYQTTLFSLASFGTIVLCLSAAWRLRVLHLRKQFKIVLTERVRIAREIHDTLLQGLAGVAVQIDGVSRQLQTSPEDTIGRLDRIRSMVGRYIRETRSSIWLLRSQSLEEQDLPNALRDAAETLIAGSPVQFRFEVTGRARALTSQVRYELLCIVNEAILNTLRHAGAPVIHVTLQYHADSVLVRVSDTGCGFDTNRPVTDNGARFGLVGMGERAKEIGAVLKLSSVPGSGTDIEVVVPF